MFFVSQYTTLNAYRSSHEVEVLSSSPIELIRLLYKGALEAVEAARLHLSNGKIRERSTAITKATLILDELTVSLDLERGGKLAVGLRDLYGYMQRRLTQANIEQSDPPLADVLSLICTLNEAWSQIDPPEFHSSNEVIDTAEISHSYSC